MKIAQVLLETLIFASFVGTFALALSHIIWPRDSDDDFVDYFDTYEEEIEKQVNEDEASNSKEEVQVVPVNIGDTAV